MERLVFILISILTINSSCSETVCEKANEAAINDFSAGQYSLHSEEVLPVDNAYFYVLRQYYKVNWYFTDSLDYYRCYDSTMLTFLNKKYQVDILAKARETADSLERTPNWNKAAEYPGGMQEVVKFVVNKIRTNGRRTQDIKGTKVFVQFIINTSGQVKNAEIMKGEINESIDKQIVDIISSTQWIPEYQYGKPIDTRMVIPIQFEFE